MTDVAALIEDMVRAGVDASVVGEISATLARSGPRIDCDGLRRLLHLGLTNDQIVSVVEIMEEVAFSPAAPRSRVAPPPIGGWKSGPKARWGYDGSITPRLPEKEWLVLRGQILRRDDFVCAYCGVTEAQWCVDHVVPLSRGGTNDPDNLVACCFPCNSSKSDRLLGEWGGRH